MRLHKWVVKRVVFGAALLPLVAWSACPPPCTPPLHAKPLSEFLFGVSQLSSSSSSEGIAIARDAGAKIFRSTFAWGELEPNVQKLSLTLDQVRDPQVVADYIAQQDWTGWETRVQEAQTAGLAVLPIVGHGYSGNLPWVAGEKATPDALGREEYLARQYLVTRATVERFDADGEQDAPGNPRVDLWQIENEVNQAFLTAVFGWRHPSFLNAFQSAWADTAFVQKLVEVLATAVRDADTEALTVANFHSDVHPQINRDFGQPAWWEWLSDWHPFLDVVGLDAYPNYYVADPVQGDALAERIKTLTEHACGRPVIVMETGYPSGPAEQREFSEEKQAQYFEQAFESAVGAGASGFLWFGAKTAEVLPAELLPPNEGITGTDLENLRSVGQWFEEGNTAALLAWALAQEPGYVAGHFGAVLRSVEPFWGFVHHDGSHKPMWDAFADAAGCLPPLP